MRSLSSFPSRAFRKKLSWRVVAFAALLGVSMGTLAGNTPSNNQNNADDDGCNSPGCPTANIVLSMVSIRVVDDPVGYKPPVGPEVRFSLVYNEFDPAHPANPPYSNVGPQWTTRWLAFISDDPNRIGSGVTLTKAGGGRAQYSGFSGNASGGTFAREERTGAILSLISSSPIVYQRVFPDGSKEIYSQADSGASPRLVFLTSKSDPHGNALTFGYDDNSRLVTVTDAIGQTTTLQYGNPANSMLVTGVTDPFARSATIGYDGDGRLDTLTDAIGLTSSFAYGAATGVTGSVLTSMTTPYGTTRFTTWQNPSGANHRRVTRTDPLDHTTKVEFMHNAPGIPTSESRVPANMNVLSTYMNYRNTFVWDGAAYAKAPDDYTQAMIYHWLHETGGATAGTLESTKAPLESRVWYNYPGQSSSLYNGTLNRPTAIGRVLPDGSSQVTRIAYNGSSNVTSISDPIGRVTRYTYDANGIDLLAREQKNGNDFDTVERATYDHRRAPLTRTDAANQTTTLTYNAQGQPLTVVDALGQTMTLSYDAQGYLTSIKNANGKTHLSYTYDAVGRIATKTDSEGYTIKYQYDDLDRLIQETYPDSTTRVITWDKLDVASVTGRLGRKTSYTHDAARNLIAVTDPLNRTTRYAYDEANRLISLTDAAGKTTTWARDIQGRIIGKTLPDGSVTHFVYDTAGRLATRTDAQGQITTYTYAADDRLIGKSYSNAVNPTPDVAFTWDSAYPRLTAMTDGIGTTRYDYVAAGNPGALKAATETGPDGTPATIGYAYDELGRLSDRSIAGSVDTHNTYDALGRTINQLNSLGSFAYSYLGETDQVTREQLQGGSISATYGYEGNAGDRRLKSIQHNTLNLAYTSDAAGRVLSRTYGTTKKVTDTYTYDLADRVVGVTSTSRDTPNCTHPVTVLGIKLWFWGWPCNHAADQFVDKLLAALFPNGGSTSSTKTVAYRYDDADNLHAIEGSNGLSAAVNSGDQLTDVTLNGRTATWRYDPSGNLLADSGNRYTWDAENRLLSITDTATGQVVEFAYDGLDRRVAMTRNGVRTKYLWCGEILCTARDNTGAITARYLPQGETAGTASYYYARDNLGSVMAMLDSQGTAKGSATYDAYGRTVATTGVVPAFGYAGMFRPVEGAYLTYYRGYNPEVGRWISRDPIGEVGGVNLYAYAEGNPLRYTDPLGLYPGESVVNYVGGAVGGAGDFGRNYRDMRNANTIGGDKYFHCKANCEATKRGDGGRDAASCISDAREWADQHWPKNDPASASAADQIANHHGRNGADNNPGQSCDQICSPFRPRALPANY